MNKLLLYLDLQESFSDYVVHPELIKELMAILKSSGNEKAFITKLKTNLAFLSLYGVTAHLQPTNQFEKLKNADNLYSMHIRTKSHNVRIIYSFLPENKILLHGFHERSGKKATDYCHAIHIASDRLKNCLEGEST